MIYLFIFHEFPPLRRASVDFRERVAQAAPSDALAHAHEQLHANGDAGVPAQRQQADVARHDGRAQKVLHRGRAVRISVEDLGGRRTTHHRF